jgi:hypothetical protein
MVPKGIVGDFVPARLQELVGTERRQLRPVITPRKGALNNLIEPAPWLNIRWSWLWRIHRLKKSKPD